MAGHYPGILMTGHIGTDTPKFVPPRWGRPPFDPTQTQRALRDILMSRGKNWLPTVSRQKLAPHCLAAIFDSELPSPKLSLKMPPKLPLPHKRGHFFLFQTCPCCEGNCAAIERQKLSPCNFCIKMPLRALWERGCANSVVGLKLAE